MNHRFSFTELAIEVAFMFALCGAAILPMFLFARILDWWLGW